MQAVSQIANEVLLSGAERKCPGMQQGHGHGSAVRDGTADAVHPPGILLRNADADGDVIAFADRVEDRAAVRRCTAGLCGSGVPARPAYRPDRCARRR